MTIKTALTRFLENADEHNRRAAAELGRNAYDNGVGVLEWAGAVHAVIFETIESTDAPDVRQQIARAAQVFLMECLSHYEMALQTPRETIIALRHEIERMEAQAKRVAREMHDTASQSLVSAYMELHLAAHASSEAAPYLSKATTCLDQVQMQLRRLAQELRPTVLDDLGLMPALRALSQRMAVPASIDVKIEGDTNGRLAPPVEVALYRTAEEALSNAVKHSGAAHVEILVERRAHEVRCTVTDDGVGFPEPDSVRSPSLGLIGLRERLQPLGGNIRWESIPSAHGSMVVA
ncbi:MAG TPA: ATP-binding protein, partial [Candidatus Krumholzibacteria bacterium]|nr:ATP-binding protein [Candidatus Krumholzibacteria bacterium]